jgi:hypothetical protein
MSRRSIASFLIVAFLAFILYFVLNSYVSPSDIQTKGTDPSLTLQYVSLATAIVSLLTAIVGLLKGTLKSGSGADT